MRGGAFGTRVRAHAIALGTFGALGALAIVGPTVLAGNPDAALGVYGVVLGNVDVSSTLVWFVRHLADLDLYVGLVPFAATLILLARSLAGRADRVTDEFVALAGWTIVCMVGDRRRVRIEAAGGRAKDTSRRRRGSTSGTCSPSFRFC